MKKIFLTLALLFMVFPSQAQMCNTVGGYAQCDIDVVRGRGVFPEPAVANSGQGAIYYDYADDKWKCSEDGGAYVDFCSAGGGAGGGHVIQDEGSDFTQRTNLNFVGSGVTVTDDAGNDATIVTVSASGGGSCWEENGDGDLMPVSGSCTDSLWEENGDGDLMPQT